MTVVETDLACSFRKTHRVSFVSLLSSLERSIQSPASSAPRPRFVQSNKQIENIRIAVIRSPRRSSARSPVATRRDADARRVAITNNHRHRFPRRPSRRRTSRVATTRCAPRARCRVSHAVDRWRAMRSRPSRASSSRASSRVARRLKNTHLDLGRLEGGDAADEGGSEKGRHCRNVRVQECRSRAREIARHRSIDRSIDRSIARSIDARSIARDARTRTRRSRSRSRAPRRIKHKTPRSRDIRAFHAVFRPSRKISFAARPRPRARLDRHRWRAARRIHAHSVVMSALLASSFVGRVAAFKATKIQVRIF